MPTTQEATEQSKRPALGRHVSASSYASQSPSDTSAQAGSYKARGHKPQKRVVGKLGRNVSFGKNIDKLSSNAGLTATQAETAEPPRLHRRSKSGDGSAPSSPAVRPTLVKRNMSAAQMKRNTSHTTLRKNLSSGHLPRHGSAKNLAKHGKAEAPRMKRSSSDKGKASRQSQSPPPRATHPTVRFDVGDDDQDDDAEEGWTEDSASQSPETTRSNTRANSVIGDRRTSVDGSQDSRPPHRREPSDPVVRFAPTSPSPPQSAQRHSISDSLDQVRMPSGVQQINGQSSYLSSAHGPDADAITSRLLQRAPSHGVAPQTSNITASVHADAHNPRLLSHSQNSMLGSADTPGSKDLVSRFINGPGSGGNTPSSSFLPQKQRPTEAEAEAIRSAETAKLIKRNKSAPNMAHPLTAAASASSHRRTGSSDGRPASGIADPDPNPSRTQQKLWLQRASSTIEPSKMIPSVLPKTSVPPLLGMGVNYSADSTGRLDPRLQRQFDQVQLEYRAIRRYRNPLAEAIKQLGQCTGPRKEWMASGASANASTAASLRTPDHHHRDGARTPVSGMQSRAPSSRASIAGSARNSGAVTPARGHAERDAEVGHEPPETRSHRSRVSFEVPDRANGAGDTEDAGDQADEDDDDDTQDSRSLSSSVDHVNPAPYDDTFELCRRLWDMPAAGEGG